MTGCSGAASSSRLTKRKSHPAFQPVLRQAAGLLVEDLALLHMRCADQPAIEGIGPGVIGTGEAAGIALALGHRHGAMPADGIQRAHLAILAAHDDDRLAHNVDGVIVAGIGHIFRAADAEPGFLEDGLDLERVEFRRGIGFARQRETGRIGQARIFGQCVQQRVQPFAHRPLPLLIHRWASMPWPPPPTNRSCAD